MADRNIIHEKIASMKKALESNELTVIRSALEELTKASHKVAEEMYKHSAAQAGAQSGQGPQSGGPSAEAGSAGGPSSKPTEEGAVDAEFEETKKDSKEGT
jgi:molecular chaperone DnaK